ISSSVFSIAAMVGAGGREGRMLPRLPVLRGRSKCRRRGDSHGLRPLLEGDARAGRQAGVRVQSVMARSDLLHECLAAIRMAADPAAAMREALTAAPVAAWLDDAPPAAILAVGKASAAMAGAAVEGVGP